MAHNPAGEPADAAELAAAKAAIAKASPSYPLIFSPCCRPTPLASRQLGDNARKDESVLTAIERLAADV